MEKSFIKTLNSDDHGPERTLKFGNFVECKEQGNIVRKIWLNSPEITQELIQESLSLRFKPF